MIKLIKRTKKNLRTKTIEQEKGIEKQVYTFVDRIIKRERERVKKKKAQCL